MLYHSRKMAETGSDPRVSILSLLPFFQGYLTVTSTRRSYERFVGVGG